MLQLDEAAQKALIFYEEAGIHTVDILVYFFFLMELNSDDEATRLEKLKKVVKVPSKREKAIIRGSKDSQEWIMFRIARAYHKKISGTYSETQHIKTVGELLKALFLYHRLRLEETNGDIETSMKKLEERIREPAEATLTEVLKNYTMFLICLDNSFPQTRMFTNGSGTFSLALVDYSNKIDECEKTEELSKMISSLVLDVGFMLFISCCKDRSLVEEAREELYGFRPEALDYLQNNIDTALQIAVESEEELINERMEYSDRYTALLMDLSELKKENNRLQKKVAELEIENKTLKLGQKKLKKVLVVGDPGHKESYQEIIEEHGAEFSFIDGVEEPHRAGMEAMKADVVFFVTAYSKHVAHNQLKQLDKVVHVNTAGVKSFKMAIEKFMISA